MVKFYRRKSSRKPSNKKVTASLVKFKSASIKKPVSNYIANNRSAIVTLSKQVKNLQMSQLGLLQRKSVAVSWYKPTDTAYPFSNTRPLCLCLNQFVGEIDTTITPHAPKLPALFYTDTGGNGIAFRRFAPYLPSVFASGATPALNPHFMSNDNKVSSEVYKPLGCKVSLQLSWNTITETTQPGWIRIDIIRPKKTLLQTVKHELNMPLGLGQFANLAHQDQLVRNYINPTLWHVKDTRWIKMTYGAAEMDQQQKTLTFKRSYKNDPIMKPDLNAVTVTGVYSSFFENMSPQDLEWMIISTEGESPYYITIKKEMVWRDQHGTSM